MYACQTPKTFHSSIGDKSQGWLLSLENLRPKAQILGMRLAKQGCYRPLLL